MQSHHNLSFIFYLLWDKQLAPRGSFTDLVFRLVLFHRSLDGIDSSQNMVNLTNNERMNYCDVQMFKLINVLMIADSQSYIFLGYIK